MDNEIFLCDSLNDITFELFEMACVAVMSEKEEMFGLVGIRCSPDDFILYRGKGKAKVTLRNWSSMLELHVVSSNGTWLVSSHIDGMSSKIVIAEAYRQFRTAEPYINKKCDRAFKDMELSEGAESRWIKGNAEIMKRIEEFVNRKEAEHDE